VNLDRNQFEIQIPNQSQITDKTVRLGFIRKVFAILTFQLLYTVGFAALSMFVDKLGSFMVTNLWLLYLSAAISIVVMLIVACFTRVARKVPLNYFMLGLFTVATAYWVGVICAVYEQSGSGIYVLIALVLTAGMTLGLTLFACFTKRDITTKGWSLFVVSLGLFMFLWLAIFFHSSWLYTVLASLIVILFGVYLVYDVQLIMGNKTVKLSEDDYIIGALVLYTDIITIFLYLLSLIGNIDR